MKQLIALATLLVAAHAATDKTEVLDEAEQLIKKLNQVSTLDKK